MQKHQLLAVEIKNMGISINPDKSSDLSSNVYQAYFVYRACIISSATCVKYKIKLNNTYDGTVGGTRQNIT